MPSIRANFSSFFGRNPTINDIIVEVLWLVRIQNVISFKATGVIPTFTLEVEEQWIWKTFNSHVLMQTAFDMMNEEMIGICIPEQEEIGTR